MLNASDLHEQQVQSYRDILKVKTMCISSDCGYGKTIVGLSAFALLLKKKLNSKMLVVCTAQGVKQTWTSEHLMWTHTKHLRVAVLNQPPHKRLALLKENKHDVYIISYNSLKWLLESNKNKIKFNFVYADEGDCLKGPSSKWRSQLIKIAPNANYKIISSATPKTREEDDYWGLCKYLDNGQSLNASTVTEFRHMYCKSFVFNNRQVWRINKKMIEKLETRIAHLFFNYSLTESSKIPIKTRTIYTKLTDSSMVKYKTLQKEQCVNSVIKDKHGRKDLDKSLDAMTLSGKLAQLSNGFLYVDDNLRITVDMLVKTTNVKSLLNKSKRTTVVDVFDDRIRSFAKLIRFIHKNHGKCSIAIPYYYKHELVQLKRILPNGVSDTTPRFQNLWNSGKIDYLFLQYSRSSKSLNLQAGGYVMAFYSPTFKWVDDYQIVRRLARQGQKQPVVYVYRLYIKGTIDDLKCKRLNERFIGHSRFQNKLMNKYTTDN